MPKPSRPPLGRYAAGMLRRISAACLQVVERPEGDRDWPAGLQLLAMVRVHEREGEPTDFTRFEEAFDRRITGAGKWKDPLERVGQVLPAYSLLYLQRLRPTARWQEALHEMADFLVNKCPREEDGSLRYVPHRCEILVDTLGMVCPFLAAYGREFSDVETARLARLQLSCFIGANVDRDSHLPFHGYRVNGPYRLGLHGWGRGVGWYMLGLVDTLVELAEAGDKLSDDSALTTALQQAASTLARWQRPDGHWAWVIPMPDQQADSSATALCGYALARAWQMGLLQQDPTATLNAAKAAILRMIDSSGRVGAASGECRGLGVYSMRFGPQPWAQAASAAFLSQWPSSR